MINLLPEKEKQALLLRRIKNLIFVLGGAAVIFSVCLILVLLSIKFYILNEISSQKSYLESIPKNPRAENIRNAIKNYNNILPMILSFYQKQTYFGDILGTISGVKKPDGVKFSNIYLGGQGDEAKVLVRVSGTNDTRENLTLLKKNLESNSAIKNVYFSQESWINPTNASFTFTLEFAKNGH
jgi:hypothetical protein